ncbi:methyltransferase domain-containing protein [Staphylococcus gallinarum]|uniref:methyltransferase domain-containing protein n=1 Tax=Staphylococcus gallinarum TaxID=1293 RepID=UPI0030C0A220
MELNKHDWNFGQHVVPTFDDHVSKSVPFYNEIHKMINSISGWFIRERTNVYDIGSSTGTLLSRLKDTYNKEVEYIGIDNSEDMVAASLDTLSEVQIKLADITNDYSFENASLIMSVLTLQFIREDLRQNVINNIYEGLNSGGAFILVEKVLGNDAKFNEMWADLYHDLKLENGLSKEHIFDKSRSIRGVMNPVTVEENIEMIKSAGFEKIDTFFKWNNFIGVIAIK